MALASEVPEFLFLDGRNICFLGNRLVIAAGVSLQV